VTDESPEYRSQQKGRNTVGESPSQTGDGRKSEPRHYRDGDEKAQAGRMRVMAEG